MIDWNTYKIQRIKMFNEADMGSVAPNSMKDNRMHQVVASLSSLLNGQPNPQMLDNVTRILVALQNDNGGDPRYTQLDRYIGAIRHALNSGNQQVLQSVGRDAYDLATSLEKELNPV